MNTCRAAVILVLAGAATTAPGDDVEVWDDEIGDAVIRRTDWGADGPINSLGVIPDLVRVSLCGWEPYDPVADRFTGQVIDPESAHLFRLEVLFAGLVNPPGPLGITGEDYEPYRHGGSPVYGYIDVDVDDEDGTGGELGGAALTRYLANVARFGGRPEHSIGERIAESAYDYDTDFYSDPQYERTGADFALIMCGCWELTVLSQDGNMDGIFDAGEQWVVAGRFFERTRGYQQASACYGGSDLGLYDPITPVQFTHDQGSDRTSVVLVGALDMEGASMLAGEPEQEMDLDVGNHSSLAEALQDIIDGAYGLTGPVDTLTRRWRGCDPADYLDPTQWDVTALLGTAYSIPQDSLFVWTDQGFKAEVGDLDGDSSVTGLDRWRFEAALGDMDGSLRDGDGVADGKVEIVNFGTNFSLYDLTGDGVIGEADRALLPHAADMNGDGVVNSLDFILFLNAFVQGDLSADFNLDGIVNSQDFIGFLNAFVGA